MAWRSVASVVAREAAYRSSRKYGKDRTLLRISGGSVLKYNAMIMAILCFISVSMGMAAFGGREVVLPVFPTMFLLEVLLGTMIMAINLQVLISDKLLEPLYHLPLEEADIRRALSWLSIYWGGAALPFLVVPGSLLIAYILNDWGIALSGTLMSVAALVLAIGLGYLVGSIAPRYTRSLKGRLMSTFAWLLILLIGFIMGPTIEHLSEELSAGHAFIRQVPPLSFFYMFEDVTSLLSSILTFLFSLLVLKYGINRFWRLATRGEVPLPKAPAKWSISYGLRASLAKEFKLISRTPRLLASTLVYSVIFPLSFVLSVISEPLPPELMYILPPMAVGIGGLGGLSIFYLYTAEAAGAQFLYLLPIRRSDVGIIKFLVFTIANLPLIAAIGLVFSLLQGALGLLPFILYASTFIGSALLNSLLYANFLPKEQSHWSSETFGRNLLALIVLGEGTSFLGMAGLIVITLPSQMLKISASLAVTLAVWIIALTMYVGARRPL